MRFRHTYTIILNRRYSQQRYRPWLAWLKATSSKKQRSECTLFLRIDCLFLFIFVTTNITKKNKKSCAYFLLSRSQKSSITLVNATGYSIKAIVKLLFLFNWKKTLIVLDFQNLEIWKSGNLEIWKSGNLEIPKFGNLEIWKSGNSKIWKFGNLEIWKFQNLESRLPYSVYSPKACGSWSEG